MSLCTEMFYFLNYANIAISTNLYNKHNSRETTNVAFLRNKNNVKSLVQIPLSLKKGW